MLKTILSYAAIFAATGTICLYLLWSIIYIANHERELARLTEQDRILTKKIVDLRYRIRAVETYFSLESLDLNPNISNFGK